MAKTSKDALERGAIEAAEGLKNPVGGTVLEKNKHEGIDPRMAKIGWHEIPREQLPYGGLYPSTWTFRHRAALGKEVAFFSTINPEDPFSVLEGMNLIITTCVEIVDQKDGHKVNTDMINEVDRLFFVLKVRDLTMPERENQLRIEDKCDNPNCRHLNVVEVSSQTLVSKPMSDFAKRYYNPTDGTFNFVTKSSGTIRVKLSTIKLANIIQNYLKTTEQRDIDERFVSRLWMFVEDGDYRNEETLVKNAYERYIDAINSQKKFQVYAKIEKSLDLGIENQMKYICEQCGKEVHTNVRFPNGLENIFIMSDIDSEFV